MSAPTTTATETLSPWWPRSLAIMMIAGFSVLILLSVKTYENAPPIPAQAVDPNGAVVFTVEDVAAGQQVFLEYGLMDNGTIWGHGACWDRTSRPRRCTASPCIMPSVSRGPVFRRPTPS